MATVENPTKNPFGFVHLLLNRKEARNLFDNGVASKVKVPSTLVFESGIPQRWLMSVDGSPTNVQAMGRKSSTPHNIHAVWNSTRSRDSQDDPLATMVSFDGNPKMNCVALVQSIPEHRLAGLIARGLQNRHGIVQQFVPGQAREEKSSVLLHVSWTPHVTLIHREVSSTSKTAGRRKSPSRLSKIDNVLSKSTKSACEAFCSEVVKLCRETNFGNVAKMSLYFKVGNDGNVWFMWASNMVLVPDKHANVSLSIEKHGLLFTRLAQLPDTRQGIKSPELGGNPGSAPRRKPRHCEFCGTSSESTTMYFVEYADLLRGYYIRQAKRILSKAQSGQLSLRGLTVLKSMRTGTPDAVLSADFGRAQVVHLADALHFLENEQETKQTLIISHAYTNPSANSSQAMSKLDSPISKASRTVGKQADSPLSALSKIAYSVQSPQSTSQDDDLDDLLGNDNGLSMSMPVDWNVEGAHSGLAELEAAVGFPRILRRWHPDLTVERFNLLRKQPQWLGTKIPACSVCAQRFRLDVKRLMDASQTSSSSSKVPNSKTNPVQTPSGQKQRPKTEHGTPRGKSSSSPRIKNLKLGSTPSPRTPNSVDSVSSASPRHTKIAKLSSMSATPPSSKGSPGSFSSTRRPKSKRMQGSLFSSYGQHRASTSQRLFGSASLANSLPGGFGTNMAASVPHEAPGGNLFPSIRLQMRELSAPALQARRANPSPVLGHHREAESPRPENDLGDDTLIQMAVAGQGKPDSPNPTQQSEHRLDTTGNDASGIEGPSTTDEQVLECLTLPSDSEQRDAGSKEQHNPELPEFSPSFNSSGSGNPMVSNRAEDSQPNFSSKLGTSSLPFMRLYTDDTLEHLRAANPDGVGSTTIENGLRNHETYGVCLRVPPSSPASSIHTGDVSKEKLEENDLVDDPALAEESERRDDVSIFNDVRTDTEQFFQSHAMQLQRQKQALYKIAALEAPYVSQQDAETGTRIDETMVLLRKARAKLVSEWMLQHETNGNQIASIKNLGTQFLSFQHSHS